MIIDQNEINALLSEAERVVADADEPPAAQARKAATSFDHCPDDLKRLLKIKVPVIVQLAVRHMQISEIRGLSLGVIVEFEKSIEEPLDLRINNRRIALGEAVKIGENFGLKITSICEKAKRIEALGK